MLLALLQVEVVQAVVAFPLVLPVLLQVAVVQAVVCFRPAQLAAHLPAAAPICQVSCPLPAAALLGVAPRLVAAVQAAQPAFQYQGL